MKVAFSSRINKLNMSKIKSRGLPPKVCVCVCVCVCVRVCVHHVSSALLGLSGELSINSGLKSICIETKGTWAIHLHTEGKGVTEGGEGGGVCVCVFTLVCVCVCEGGEPSSCR